MCATLSETIGEFYCFGAKSRESRRHGKELRGATTRLTMHVCNGDKFENPNGLSSE